MALTREERKQQRLDAKKQKALEKEAKKRGISVEDLLAEQNPVDETVEEAVEQQEEVEEVVVEETVEAAEQPETEEEQVEVEESAQEEVEQQEEQETVAEESQEQAVEQEVVVEEEPTEESPIEEQEPVQEEAEQEVVVEESPTEETVEEPVQEEQVEEVPAETETVEEEVIAVEEPKEEKKEKASKKQSKKSSKKVESSDEDEEDEEDDDEEDNEEEAVIEGLNKKVKLKLQVASPRVQKYYSDFRNELRQYKSIKFKSNNTGDTYSFKNKVYIKVTIFAKALKIYFGLDPKAYDTKKYHQKDASAVKKYETIPLLIRVSSDRSYKYALEFVNEIINKTNAAKQEVKAYDFTQDLKTTSKELLIAYGAESLLVDTVSKEACNTISDGLAKKCMMLDLYTPSKEEKKVCEISIGELSAAFNSSYVIDLDLLKKVGLADKDANYLKVTNRNTCYKAITIKANEFDPEVIKMVILTGGNIYRLVK